MAQASELKRSLKKPLPAAATRKLLSVQGNSLIAISSASREDEFAKPESSTYASVKSGAVAASFPANAHSERSHSKKHAGNWRASVLTGEARDISCAEPQLNEANYKLNSKPRSNYLPGLQRVLIDLLRLRWCRA